MHEEVLRCPGENCPCLPCICKTRTFYRLVVQENRLLGPTNNATVTTSPLNDET